MREPIVIGNKSYKYKKDALAYYQNILNSYNFGESVSDEHLDDLIALLDYDFSFYNKEIPNQTEIIETANNEATLTNEEENDEVFIEDIRIAKVQYDSKCFEIVYTDFTTCYISYILILSRPKPDPSRDFNRACRNAIQNDMRLVKLKYFQLNSKKGLVRCQETGELHKWVDLVVDHRQPNTFSMIVERFKELKQIDVNKIEYDFDEGNKILFKDQSLMQDFVNYHKEKANLRIVKKQNNLSRSGMARVKQSVNDLKID
ncbi:MAG: DUF3223 domain-containing protein [Spirosomataceae bacterium]